MQNSKPATCCDLCGNPLRWASFWLNLYPEGEQDNLDPVYADLCVDCHLQLVLLMSSIQHKHKRRMIESQQLAAAK